MRGSHITMLNLRNVFAQSPYVPLSEAYRKLDKVWRGGAHDRLWQHLREKIDRETPPPSVLASVFPGNIPPREDQIWRVLRTLLVEGTLESYFGARGEQNKKIENELWTSAPNIEAAESRQIGQATIEYSFTGKIVLRRDQLALLIEAADRIGKDSELREKVINRGGAPAKYDAEAFLIEAFRIMYESRAAPRSPAELTKQSLDAYAEAGHLGGSPSVDWARKKIKKFWEALNFN